MDPRKGMLSGSAGARPESGVTGLDSLQFNEEIRQLMNLPQESGSSFTALLELPATQAVQLLHTADPGRPPAISAAGDDDIRRFQPTLTFPSDAGFVERAARFSVFAGEINGKISPETSSIPSNSSANLERVKSEPPETESSNPLVSDPMVENQNQNLRPMKRKEREKKVKSSTKKSKSNEKSSEDAGKLPYVHVRARRGQATDSHSLAERARREKINARMKLLQELVPGCNKISGTALVLDEIINHVQSLQRQVEFLSMRLAAVNPRIDFNLDSIVAAESGSFNDSNAPGLVMPVTWPEVQMNDNRQPFQQQWHVDAIHQPIWEREQNLHNFIAPENSLLSYDDSSANSATLHPNHVKMEQ